ncbi:hypothetical protein Ae201684P_019699 [Aphanomyces euteiches]|nr:hypothetical protein Ae201684P_019699 [Aphanomyces euteiches]
MVPLQQTHTSSRPDHKAARQYMSLVRKFLRWVTPVHADVWFRATMHMLAVNERYKYLLSTDPERVLCPHECDSRETLAHALHSCPSIAPMWSALEGPWQQFGVSLSWNNITNLDRFKVNALGRRTKDTLFQLWFMLVGVSLHMVWTQRNNRKHRRRVAPPPHVLVEQSFLQWMGTVRWWIRRQEADDPIIDQTRNVLEKLFTKTPYLELRSKYPKCLALETTFDVH